MAEAVEVKIGRWAEIDHDLLNEIVVKLNYCYDDYIRIRAVCKHWNMALPKVPCLVLPFDDDKTLEALLAKKKIYHMRLPEMRSTKIRGSSHGWLICVGIDDTLRMINPFIPKVHFYLPPLSTFPNVVSYDPYEQDNEYTVKEIGDSIPYTAESIHMQKGLQVQKVILSSPPDDNNQDFMAVVIYSAIGRLAFCRGSDNKWIDIPKYGEIECHKYQFQDAIFHEGKIYAVDFKGHLFEFDMKKRPIPLEGISKVPPPQDLNIRYYDTNRVYLISCPDGGLIMVVRHLNFYKHPKAKKGAPSCYNSTKFDIYRLNKGNMKQWTRVFKLEDCAILIGLNSSIWMSTHTLPYGLGNSIYYTDNILESQYLEEVGGHDIGVLNLEDGNICQFFPNSFLLSPPPIWLYED